MIEIKRLNLNQKQKLEFLELMSTSLSPNTVDWLDWKYINNPMVKNEPTVFGAIHKASGKLVGIKPFLACNIIFENKTFKAAQPSDTVVHPKFRREGLFTSMYKMAIEELRKEGFSLFLNFPNRSSQPGCLKIGYKKVLVFNESLAFNNFSKVVKDMTRNSFYELGAKVMSIGISKLPKIINKLKYNNRGFKASVKIEEKFDDSIEGLWISLENSKFRIKRDIDYLNWRFKERPDKKYKFWTIREKDSLNAYMITTISDRWGSKEGQIVDFHYKENKYFFIILEEILKEFQLIDKCNFVSILACTDSNIFEQLKNIGFINRFQFPYSLAMPERNFLVRALGNEMLEYDLYKGVNWSLRSGDQDTY